MRFKILGLMAAVALVAACETGPEGGAGAGGAGVAGTHHRRSGAVTYRLGGPDQRRILHPANARTRLGVHGYDLAGIQYRQPPGVSHLIGTTDEQDGDAVVLCSPAGAGDDLTGRIVSAHGVDGDRKHQGPGTTDGLDGQSTSTA